MTLVALDVANRDTTIGLFVRGELEAHFSITTSERRTSDEWFLVLDGIVERSGLPDVSEVAMCCTVPSIAAVLRQTFDRYYADAPVWNVGPGVKTGVPIHADNPKEVGADRVVNALAAKELHGGPAIVVGLNGTATVFDVIDERGRYLGGAIAPGLELSLDALRRRSAQLRSVELTEPRSPIGKNTVEALQSGSLYGFAGLVDGIVGRLLDALDDQGIDSDGVTVVATGSHADEIVDLCETVTARDPHLTLRGLKLVADKNR